jgi:16S rRNA (adenine1518-N6/adenine1519-N6)-dimethyltransferase
MKRPFGQNFLFDTNIIRKIIKCSGLAPGDTVVEIGPGLGTLTKLLSDNAKEVIAIEFDRKLIDRLKENLSEKENVKVVRADALKFPFDTIKKKFRVVANIPYNITTPILFRLLEHRDRMRSMTLLMQKEVARRITALPGGKEYGVLSISLQLYTKPALKFTVSRKVFSPPPDVDSAVVHFEVFPAPLFNVSDEGLFMKVVKTAFSQRRKRVSNSLRSFDGIDDVLSDAGVDPGERPENLGIEDFARITDGLRRSGGERSQ